MVKSSKRHSIPIVVNGKTKLYRPLKEEYRKVAEQKVQGVLQRRTERTKFLEELWESMSKHQSKSTGVPLLDNEIRYVCGEWLT